MLRESSELSGEPELCAPTKDDEEVTAEGRGGVAGPRRRRPPSHLALLRLRTPFHRCRVKQLDL